MAISLIVFLVAVWALMRLSRKRKLKAPRLWLNTQLVSTHVRQFKPQLESTVDEQYDTLTNVALVDLIRKEKETDEVELADTHLDFILLDKGNGKPVAAIQLKQSKLEAEESEELLRVLKQIKLPLISIDAENELTEEALLSFIQAKLEPTIMMQDPERKSEIRIFLEPTKSAESNAEVRLNLD